MKKICVEECLVEKYRMEKGCVEKCPREKCPMETCPTECPMETPYLEEHCSPRCSCHTDLVYHSPESRSLSASDGNIRSEIEFCERACGDCSIEEVERIEAAT
jgi:hypothetical protein